IDIDQPPPYEVASSSRTQQSSSSTNNNNTNIALNVPESATVTSSSPSSTSPLSQQETSISQQQTLSTETKKQKTSCFAYFWSSFTDPYAWICVIYFLFISFPIGVFAFCWILPTLVGAIVSMLFPPLGYFFCIGVAWSWRILARIEICAVQMCVREKIPKHIIPPITKPLHPHQLPTVAATCPHQKSWLKYFTGICFDRFTCLARLFGWSADAFLYADYADCMPDDG
ncbi:10414_t:CDS:2, partial [Ambispora leptoticha]